MRTPEEIQKRLAQIANEWDTAGRGDRIRLNVERSVLRWVLKHDIPKSVASKIINNHRKAA